MLTLNHPRQLNACGSNLCTKGCWAVHVVTIVKLAAIRLLKTEPTAGMWTLYIAGLKRKFIHLYVVVSQSYGDPEPIANPNEQSPWSPLVQIWTAKSVAKLNKIFRPTLRWL